MNPNVLIALIGAGSSGLVAITALVLNYRGFSSIDARFSSLEATLIARFASSDAWLASIDGRLDPMHAAMRNLSRRMTAIGIDIARLTDNIKR